MIVDKAGALIRAPGLGRSLKPGITVVLKTEARETDGRWTMYE